MLFQTIFHQPALAKHFSTHLLLCAAFHAFIIIVSVFIHVIISVVIADSCTAFVKAHDTQLQSSKCFSLSKVYSRLDQFRMSHHCMRLNTPCKNKDIPVYNTCIWYQYTCYTHLHVYMAHVILTCMCIIMVSIHMLYSGLHSNRMPLVMT